MQIDQATPLLGGLSPATFMHDYWQKKPLLVRAAIPGFRPLLPRAQLFALAARDDVESRLLVRNGAEWQLRHGPLTRHSLPTLKTPDWTLLVQGVDALDDDARALLDRFRFVPGARLDDLMISYATTGGGVGPHFDSYDVFLLQALGRRRWRVGRQDDLRLVDGLPLKILRHFAPEHDWVLEPGDMLYLPPKWAHDGVAVDECMTYSMGFRSPDARELAAELLFRVGGAPDQKPVQQLYADPRQPATAAPGLLPPALDAFARGAVAAMLADPATLSIALGEWLTEPKANVWFKRNDSRETASGPIAVVADRRTRMLYDAARFFINGEHLDATGADLRVLKALADQRLVGGAMVARLTAATRAAMDTWLAAGWLHARSDRLAKA